MIHIFATEVLSDTKNGNIYNSGIEFLKAILTILEMKDE